MKKLHKTILISTPLNVRLVKSLVAFVHTRDSKIRVANVVIRGGNK